MKKLTSEDPEAKTADIVAGNIEKFKALFPEAVREDGVNVDVLSQLVGKVVVDTEEKFGLNWHGKRKARQLALTPSTGTLRPCQKDSVDWETTKNLMIEGDNLEVLKLLQRSYAGKVKLVYIDPPYNTGKDFVYPDSFQDNIKNYLELTGQIKGGQKISSNTEAGGRFHTDWLNMMYPRLKLARNLLSEDGVILVSIDDHELVNLQCVLNEIFGEENHLVTAVWKKKYTGGKHTSGYVDLHEYILVYAKSLTALSDLGIERPDDEKEKFEEEDEYCKERGKFYVRPLKSNLGLRKTLIYPIVAPDGTVLETQWLVAKDTFERLLKEKRVEFRIKRDGKYQIYRKYYEKDGDGTIKPPSLIEKYPNTEGKFELKELFGIVEGRDNIFYTVKPIGLLRHLFEPYSDPDAIVLDFFAGSGTTGHAIMMQNIADSGRRRYILVQLPEQLDPDNKEQKSASDFCDKLKKPRNISELTKERLRRAAKKIKDENPLFAGDLGFRVLKLDSSNIRAWEPKREDLSGTLDESVDHIKPGRTEDDILFELLIKLGLDLTVPIEKKTIAGKVVHSIGAGVLLVCLATEIALAEVEPLALGLSAWHNELATAGESTIVFRDSAFADDVAKANLAAILQQHGLENVRSL